GVAVAGVAVAAPLQAQAALRGPAGVAPAQFGEGGAGIALHGERHRRPEDSVVDAAVVATTLALVEDAHGKFAARSQRASPRGLEFVATVTGAGGQRRQPDRIAHASGHAGRILRAVP